MCSYVRAAEATADNKILSILRVSYSLMEVSVCPARAPHDGTCIAPV